MNFLYWQPEINLDPVRGATINLRLRDSGNPDDTAMIFLKVNLAEQSVSPPSALIMLDPTRMDLDRLFDRLREGFVGFYDPLVRPLCEAAAFELLRNQPHIVLYENLSASCGTVIYGYASDPTDPSKEIANWRRNARESDSMFAPFLPNDIDVC